MPDMSGTLKGIVIALVAGTFLVTQNGINTVLKETAIPSAVVTSFASFAISTVSIVAFAALHNPACDFTLLGAPWFAYCGGLLGAGYVRASEVDHMACLDR